MVAEVEVRERARPRPAVRWLLTAAWAAGGAALVVCGLYVLRAFAPPPPHTHTRHTQPRLTGPSIAVSHTRLDLGEGRPGAQLEGSFTVSNQGSEPLEFKLSASCGCSFVRPMAGTLAPGDSQRITLGIRLPQAINSEKSTQVAIHSNDPRQPQVVCAATARAPAPWEVSPTHVNFGYVLREDLVHPPRQQILVRPGKGKHALPVSAVRVQAPGGAYRVRARARRDGTLLMDISLRPDLADGRYTSTLNLGPAEDPTLISIPLDAEVGPSVSLVPNRVWLVRDEATGTFRPAHVIVLARKSGLLLGRLETLDWPVGITLKDASPTPAPMRRVEILVDASMHLSEAGLRLAVQTAELKEPLVLTLEEHRTLAPAAAMPPGRP